MIIVNYLRNIGSDSQDAYQATACDVTLSQSTLDWGVIDVATLINGTSPMSVTLTASWSWEKGSPIQRRNWFYIDGPVEFNTTRGDIPYTGLFYKSDNPSLGFAQTKAGKTFYSSGSL